MRGRRIFDRVDPYLAPAMTDPPDGPVYDGPEDEPEPQMFVLALSRTDAAQMTNGPYVQLSVAMCPACGALVAEDQMPLHRAFHASR